MAENKKDQELSEQELSNVAGGKTAPGSGLSTDPSAKRKNPGGGLSDNQSDPGDKDRDSGLGSAKR